MAESKEGELVYFAGVGDRSTAKFYDRSQRMFVYYRQGKPPYPQSTQSTQSTQCLNLLIK
jgi:hypothetical protein